MTSFRPVGWLRPESTQAGALCCRRGSTDPVLGGSAGATASAGVGGLGVLGGRARGLFARRSSLIADRFPLCTYRLPPPKLVECLPAPNGITSIPPTLFTGAGGRDGAAGAGCGGFICELVPTNAPAAEFSLPLSATFNRRFFPFEDSWALDKGAAAAAGVVGIVDLAFSPLAPEVAACCVLSYLRLNLSPSVVASELIELGALVDELIGTFRFGMENSAVVAVAAAPVGLSLSDVARRSLLRFVSRSLSSALSTACPLSDAKDPQCSSSPR